MTDPILFLDFDGVLNSAAWLERRQFLDMSNMSRDEKMLDPDAVRRLVQIVRRTNCKIVVSSTWRLLHSMAELETLLNARGGDGEIQILDRTPDGSHLEEGPLWRPCQRGDEIQLWRKTHSHTGPFAVLDDDHDMDAVLDHFVQTSWSTGLLDEHVDEVCQLLAPSS